MSLRLKEFICNFLKSFGKEEREKYLVLIKEKFQELYSEILTKGVFKIDQGTECSPLEKTGVNEDKNSVEKRQLRKRKQNNSMNQEASDEIMDSLDEIYENEDSDVSFLDEELEEEFDEFADINCNDENSLPKKKFKSNTENNIIEAPNFKLLSCDEYGVLRKKLFIFPTEDKTMCYVYGWCNTEKKYVCWRCHHKNGKGLKFYHVSAKVCQNENKENYVKLLQAHHFCKMVKYDPENYKFDALKQIVLEPNFKIFNYEEFGIQKTKLVIFPTADKSLCYIYARKGKQFTCNRCQKKKFMFARICKNENTGQNYVKLNKNEHVCKLIKFDPENYKFNVAERIVKSPNFKLDSFKQNGVSKKKLFIFTSLEKKLGYEYYYNKKEEKFSCCGCIQLKILVTARIFEDNNGEECIKLNKAKHVCEMRNYDSSNGINYHIFYKPDYQIVDKLTRGKKIKKLFVRIQENHDLCYEFTFVKKDENFVCYRCRRGTEHQNNIRANLCHDEEGKEFIRVFDRPHLCQPLPYKLNFSEDDNIIRLPNYQFLKRNTRGKLFEKLVIFANEEKTLCYEYIKKSKDNWICSQCTYQKKKCVSSKLIKIEDQKEYIELGRHEHECEPIEFKPGTAQLNIVRKPHFILEKGRLNYTNKETKRLTIFNQSDPALCYYYRCINGENLFRCEKCHKKIVYVSAKIVRPENDDEYVILNENQHVCEMEKYEPLKLNLKIIKFPNFYIEKVKTTQGENERLMVKDWNNENNLWYSYFWHQRNKIYICHKCSKKGKRVTAKSYKTDNSDNDYIELNGVQHLCEPIPREGKQ